MIKRLGKWSLVGFILAMLLLSIASSCVSFRTKPETVDKYFQKKEVRPTFLDYKVGERHQAYVHIGEADKPLIVFVHGSPGDWGAFLHYLSRDSLLDRAQMISVDRPGFGLSDRGDHVVSLQEQAALLKPAIEKHASVARPALLVGHSLGGPLIARMAMDYPELVSGLIMVAPSIDPDLEKIRWFQYPADWKIFSWMIPTDLVTSNREILPLEGELKKMLPMWKDIQMPVTVIQGGKDRLVPAGNADFAIRMLTTKQMDMVRPEDLNHFLLWTHPELTYDAINRHLDGKVGSP